MPTLTIDGIQVTVEPGTTLIEAAKQVGKSVPHFCYHKKLSIAGNCRMCLVEVEKMNKPVVSCQVTAAEGMVVKTDSEKVKNLRKNVLEFILINHPIDCPVCDQAGECKLQEYYMDHSIADSQMTEAKVHKPKRVDLGPLVVLDDERCVLCSRCIRFCDEITKTGELCFVNRGDHQTLTTFPGMKLDNLYSLNTVDICPVGALTNKDFRFACRVWFLKETPSICTGCATGCNITINHYDDKIYRYLPRENEAVNQCWLCDEGRLSYKFVNDSSRLLRPKAKTNGQASFVAPTVAMEVLVSQVEKTKPQDIVLVGSALESNENNLALKKLADLLGVTHLYYSARIVPNPSHDDFLIKADKNPNRAGVEKLGFKPLLGAAPIHSKVCIILGGLSEAEQKALQPKASGHWVMLASNEGPDTQAADLIFPTATFAEQEGTFTNFQGRVQPFAKAFEPKGDTRPASQWIEELAVRLGFCHCEASQLLRSGSG